MTCVCILSFTTFSFENNCCKWFFFANWMRAVDQIDSLHNENNCIRWKRNGRWSDSVISGNHHELWLGKCSLFYVSMNCTKLICAIISLNSYLDPSTWKLEVISNGLERGQFNSAQPGCIISATWKAFYLYWELKRFSNGHFMLFVSICRPHNWNKCTGTTFHIPLGRNEH